MWPQSRDVWTTGDLLLFGPFLLDTEERRLTRDDDASVAGTAKKPIFMGFFGDLIGRGERIRTSDPSVPNRVLP